MWKDQEAVDLGMSVLHRVELDWIVTLQGDAGIAPLMLRLSYLGSEALPYAVAFTYFCISQQAGAKLGILLSFSRGLLLIAKWAFHLPRPYWIDPRVKSLAATGSFGMPSGHVLSASIVWPSIAAALRAKWAAWLALVLVLLVSVSRVYLGAHFVSDVVVAWCLGAFLVWIGNLVERCFRSGKWNVGDAENLSLGFRLEPSRRAGGPQPAVNVVSTAASPPTPRRDENSQNKFAPCTAETGRLLSRPSGTLSSARCGGEGWGEEVQGQDTSPCRDLCVGSPVQEFNALSSDTGKSITGAPASGPAWSENQPKRAESETGAPTGRAGLRAGDGLGFWPEILTFAIGAGLLICLGLVAQSFAHVAVQSQPWASFAGNVNDSEGLFKAAGGFFGVGCAWAMARRWAVFDTSGPWWRRIVACVYAYCGFWLLPSLSEMLPFRRTEAVQGVIGFVFEALKNYWLFFISPWILLKVGILVPSRADGNGQAVAAIGNTNRPETGECAV